MRIICSLLLVSLLIGCSHQYKKSQQDIKSLDQSFQNPPDSVRPWVFWIWTNGNISRKGITEDLEAMKRVGIGGALWYETGGPWWPPAGNVAPYSKEWFESMQWAVTEAGRLNLGFGMNLGYGYGAGGPHISPDISIQKLYWSKTLVKGGKRIDIDLPRPQNNTDNILDGWLKRAGSQKQEVVEKLKLMDSYVEAEVLLTKMKEINYYKDVAVTAIQASSTMSDYKFPEYDLRTGLGDQTYFLDLEPIKDSQEVLIPKDKIIDVTRFMKPDGSFSWDAPPGDWLIIRFGHAPNYRLSRPVPTGAVGLECTKLRPDGINMHFEKFLKPILENAGPLAGNTFKYIHIASWEDGPQNWELGFHNEFLRRRGYDLTLWLPALTGNIVESPELTDRFLWDFRLTISELTLENYHRQLRDLSSGYNVLSSREAYGNLCIDNLKYAETCDLPVSEFWEGGNNFFPDFGNSFKVKSMSSVSHTVGVQRAGCEAFTYTGKLRSLKEHPYLVKGIGDQAFCQGINHFFLHLSCHQAYNDMKPGLMHRHAGGHYHRQNTWFEYSKPWMDYLARCQLMLQQGRFVADVIYFFGEGAPLNVKDMDLDLPQGHDYDVCSSDILQQMTVRNGNILLPSGIVYRYLLLPDNDRLTLSSAKKIKDLIDAGAKVVAQHRITGTPGLQDYPEGDKEVKQIANTLWDDKLVITENNWSEIFNDDGILPDFTGDGLNYIHGKSDETDIYFIANPEPVILEKTCTFRNNGKIPELWDPETGKIVELTEFRPLKGQIEIPLRFGPFQSWFIVFRKNKSSERRTGKNFPENKMIQEITGPWQIVFNPEWGGPAENITFDNLQDWSKSSDTRIRYYSGTATYRKKFNIQEWTPDKSGSLFIDLGRVEIIAKIRINGQDCGIAWKPPYRVDITNVVKEGENELEIDLANLWANRMIGDEQLPEDINWIDWQVMKEWPDWFNKPDTPRSSGRYTFTTIKVFEKQDTLFPSGLIGPVRIYSPVK